LIFWKTEVQTVVVVKLGVYDGGGNCFSRVKVKVWTDTAESTNMMTAGFRQCRDLIEEWEMFIKYGERAVASRSRRVSIEVSCKNKVLHLLLVNVLVVKMQKIQIGNTKVDSSNLNLGLSRLKINNAKGLLCMAMQNIPEDLSVKQISDADEGER